MKKNYLKIIFIVALMTLFFVLYQSGLLAQLNLETLKDQKGQLQQYFTQNPLQSICAFMGLYILATALSLPGATVLTLGAGAVFGLFKGLILVSFASSIGATLAFLSARFLFRDSIAQKYSEKLKPFMDGIKKDGAFYLFTLRLIPVFPFFLINLVMGLTPIKTSRFYIVSQIAMLPGTAAYVNAGTQLSQISSLKEILSFNIFLAFAILGLLPLFSKFLLSFLQNRKLYKGVQKPKKFDYNLVVIGAGAAGLVSSYIASAVKAKVALIEKHKMGGDCLNTGCVPSKALIRSSKILHYIKNAQNYGIKKTSFEFSFSEVMERVQSIIKRIEAHDSVERYESLGVQCIQGKAKITSPYTIEVNNKTVSAKNIIVATGARPFIPSIPGLSEVNAFTSDNIWELKELPKRLLVLGGGPIGSELSQAFARLGAEVTQVEAQKRILIREDADVSQTVAEQFKNDGVQIKTEHLVERFEKNGGQQIALCQTPQGVSKIEFDALLLAIGRKANTTGFGLEELGMEFNENGTLKVDEFMQSKYPNILACGDVAGPYQFTHTAAHQAWYASVNALFSPFKKFRADYRVIPWCTFTDPEVARVGLNEQEAQDKGLNYEVTQYGIDDLDRAIADNEAKGFVKVITPKGSDKILGATIVGHHAGDLMAEFVTCMKYGLGLNKILGTIHIYPTLAESNKFAAGVWKKNNAPKRLLSFIEKFHQWRRN